MLRDSNIGSSSGFQPESVGSIPTSRFMDFDKSKVLMRPIDYKLAKRVIVDNHYSHTMPCCELALGFYICDPIPRLNCVIVFGPSATAKMRDSLPSPNYWELVRLFSYDWSGKNTESYCISQALKYAESVHKKDVIVSFADPSAGHCGYIYQASNWLYCGLSSQTGGYTYFFDGKWQHPRTTVSKFKTREHSKILSMFPGVQFKKIPRKHRYIYLLGDKRRKKELLNKLKYPLLPYPKGNNLG
jgi:hypothetical protein